MTVNKTLVATQSLPSRERGLKSCSKCSKQPDNNVAPFAGARIEILDTLVKFGSLSVAPFAGARIEIWYR